jgi:hypothetical protein
MGDKTRDALKTFQQRQGFNATGTLDIPTQSALGIGPAGAPRSSGGTPGTTDGSAGIRAEPAIPRDPSVKPGEPLPPETPPAGVPSNRTPGSSTSGTSNPSGAQGSAGVGTTNNSGGAAGGAGGAGSTGGGRR